MTISLVLHKPIEIVIADEDLSFLCARRSGQESLRRREPTDRVRFVAPKLFQKMVLVWFENFRIPAAPVSVFDDSLWTFSWDVHRAAGEQIVMRIRSVRKILIRAVCSRQNS
jgi:hypothetical protein